MLTLKRLSLAFVLGALAPVVGALHLGPDAMIAAGVKWQAAQRSYVVFSEPVRELDETGVQEILAVPVKAPRKVAKR